MVSQQAVRVSVCDRLDMFSIQRKEVRVIPFFDKQILVVIAAIVDVIVHTWHERSSCKFHICYETSQVFKTCEVYFILSQPLPCLAREIRGRGLGDLTGF